MAAFACFVPAPRLRVLRTPVALVLGFATWLALGFVLGSGVALMAAPDPGPLPDPSPPIAEARAQVERRAGLATFYRPAGSRAVRPALQLKPARFEPRRGAFAMRSAILR